MCDIEGEKSRAAEQELQDKLVQMVEDVVDTVATFDGRIGYVQRADGRWDVTFRARDGEFQLTIFAATVKAGDVRVVAAADGIPLDEGDLVYEGPFDAKVVRYRISTSMALWYRQMVVHPSSR
ncbi:hypothetical protein NZD89_21810 [Alicyclobacillus fastidiosus]|uniref:Uncharacterized protein n=1 Tax=Alicyclobacillus fastidiosus TaxID=392011 RepID=A0ABY6ZDU6_9BACL|nr:hypothetical protein [Alicyclobacillus fastidiosus]WAH40900.1 hypothetical protein NZD89_21810 [Alicyclobacillus fastidiosus]GMA62393.1 hypothetical protein GCM10025859_28330 [Alicyclobacillus fastidiosus]